MRGSGSLADLLAVAVLDALADAMVLVGTDGRIVAANQLFASLIGLTPEDLIGSRVLELAPELGRVFGNAAILELRPYQLAELIVQAADAMRPMAEGARVCLEVEPYRLTVTLDSDRMLQVLTNLLSNAIKFSPPDSAVRLSAACDGFEVRLYVDDHGRGIPPDKLESIFERFKQVDACDARQKGGTGLGLAICKTIVQQHADGSGSTARSAKGRHSR
jgi:PAS domain S-box-containing protein